jgi:hypothetical protein
MMSVLPETVGIVLLATMIALVPSTWQLSLGVPKSGF